MRKRRSTNVEIFSHHVSPFTPGTFIAGVEPLGVEVCLPSEIVLVQQGLNTLGPQRPPVVKHLLLPSLLVILPGQTLPLRRFLQTVGVRIARLL